MKESSIFVSDNISVSRLLPTYFTSDSNLFLIDFILISSVITLYGFLFLRCLISLISQVFSSLIGSERKFSDLPYTLWLFYPTDQKAKSFHLSVPLNFKLLEFLSENTELVYLYFLGLDVILSVVDVVY